MHLLLQCQVRGLPFMAENGCQPCVKPVVKRVFASCQQRAHRALHLFALESVLEHLNATVYVDMQGWSNSRGGRVRFVHVCILFYLLMRRKFKGKTSTSTRCLKQLHCSLALILTVCGSLLEGGSTIFPQCSGEFSPRMGGRAFTFQASPLLNQLSVWDQETHTLYFQLTFDQVTLNPLVVTLQYSFTHLVSLSEFEFIHHFAPFSLPLLPLNQSWQMAAPLSVWFCQWFLPLKRFFFPLSPYVCSSQIY